MEYAIRRPIATDAEEVAALSRELSDKYFEPKEEWKKACEREEPHRRYWVACRNDGLALTGYACIRPDLPRQPGYGKFRISLGVAQGWRKQGIGLGLLDAVIQDLYQMKAAAARVRVEEGSEPLEFFKRSGFVEYERMVRLRADLPAIDTSCTDLLISGLDSRGITITTLGLELRHTADCLFKLYELEKKIAALLPTTDPVVPVTYDVFLDHLARNKELDEGYFIAMENGNYIGCSYLMKKESDPRGISQGLTGVLRSYQNRGIATALKYCTLRYSKQNGYQFIETASLSHNASMLAVQQKAGFRIEASEVRLEKKLMEEQACSLP